MTGPLSHDTAGDATTRVQAPQPSRNTTGNANDRTRKEYPMAQRRADHDYYESSNREDGFPLATTIKWIGIVTVTLIVAYVAVQILSTLQAIF